MIDVTAVTVRAVAALLSVDFISVTTFADPRPSDTLEGVVIGNEPVPFVRLSDARVCAFVTGEPQRALLAYRSGDGAPFSQHVDALDTVDLGLRVVGRNTGGAQLVYVNGQSRPFYQAAPQLIYVRVKPEDIVTAPSVEVVVSATTINTDAIFEYSFPAGDVGVAAGAAKAVVQFVKALMTSRGSSSFDPQMPGGNLRAMAGTLVGGDYRTLSAQVVTAVTLCGQQLAAAHVARGVPPSERIVGASTMSVSVDDQTGSIALEVRLLLADGQAAIFSMVADTIASLPQS